jgi:hypothetical protein
MRNDPVVWWVSRILNGILWSEGVLLLGGARRRACDPRKNWRRLFCDVLEAGGAPILS